MSNNQERESNREAIVFIDGNNFYHNINKMGINPSRINFYKLCLEVCDHFNSKFKKAIYYNSVPSIGDGKRLYANHMGFLNKVKSYPNFEVVTRKLQKSSNKEKINEKRLLLSKLKLCGNCIPIVEVNCIKCLGNVKKREKGIDVNIAVDMLDKGILKKESNLCILISGDGDFIPAMDLLKKYNVDVVSAFIPPGYSSKLRQSHGWFIISDEIINKRCFD